MILSSVGKALANIVIGDMSIFARVLQSIQRNIALQEPAITRYDTLMGDGDCGTTLVAGADAVLTDFTITQPVDIATAFLSLASTVRDAMGGTSGALYGLYWGAFASALQEEFVAKSALDVSVFVTAATQALQKLQSFTAARKGSRTLMDALIPLIEAMQLAVSQGNGVNEVLEKGVQAAKVGMENTKDMVSAFGRSTYVAAGTTESNKGVDATIGIPDPGACGIVTIVEGIAAVFKTV